MHCHRCHRNLICRRGKVTKPDICAIRITENETRFEKFKGAIVHAEDDDVAITPYTGTPDDGVSPHTPRKKFKGGGKPKFGGGGGFGKPKGDKPKFAGPKSDKPKYGKAAGDKPVYKGKKGDWKKGK